MADFGSALRRERERWGWTQKELADRAGVHAQYISLIERGEALPSVEVLSRIIQELTRGEYGPQWDRLLNLTFQALDIELNLPLPVDLAQELAVQLNAAPGEVWVLTDLLAEQKSVKHAASTAEAIRKGLRLKFFGPHASHRFRWPDARANLLKNDLGADEIARAIEVFTISDVAFGVRLRILNPLSGAPTGAYSLGDRSAEDLFFFPAPQTLVSDTVDRLDALLTGLGEGTTYSDMQYMSTITRVRQ